MKMTKSFGHFSGSPITLFFLTPITMFITAPENKFTAVSPNLQTG